MLSLRSHEHVSESPNTSSGAVRVLHNEQELAEAVERAEESERRVREVLSRQAERQAHNARHLADRQRPVIRWPEVGRLDRATPEEPSK